MVIAGILIKYVRTLHYPDKVMIESRVAACQSHGVLIEQQIWSHSQRAVVVRAAVRLVFFDSAAERKRLIPPSFVEAVEKFEGRPIPFREEKRPNSASSTPVSMTDLLT